MSPLISIRRHDAAVIAGMLKGCITRLQDSAPTGDALIDGLVRDEIKQALEMRDMLLAAVKVARSGVGQMVGDV